MKAELDENGTLVIWSESSIESFALTHWHNLWIKKKSLFLVQTIERSEDGIGTMDKGLTEVKPR